MYKIAKEKIANVNKLIKTNIRINDIIVMIAGMLSGRTFIFYNMSPFGIACICAYILKNYSPIVCLLPMLGIVTSGKRIWGLKYILMYFFMGITAFFSNKIKSDNIKLCIGFLGAFVGCVFYFLISGASVYSFIVMGLEFIGAYFLYDYYISFFSYFETKKIRKTMTRKELFSLSAVFLITLASVADLKIIYEISLVGIVADVIILFTGLEFNTGVCSVAGVLLGSVMGIANPEMLYCIGSYSVSSVFVSFGAKYGKTGAIAAFILTNAFFTFYANDSSYILVNIFEIIIAGMIIYLTPVPKMKKIKRNIMVLMPTVKVREAMRVEMVKKEAGERMKKLSQVFERMAYVITKNNKKTEIGQEKEEKMLVENVAQRVCRRCRNCKKCWVDNYKDTYKVVVDLLRATKIRGWSEHYDVPPFFKNICYNPSALVLEVNKVYELYRVNTVWEDKIMESRKLINQQLCDVSKVVDGIAEEIQNGYSFELEAEEKLIEFLDNLGVRVSEVSVLKEKEERYQINICVVECRRGNVCHLTIVPAAEKILKRRFYAEERECVQGKCNIVLKEREWFDADVGVSRVRQKGEKEWGDSYAIIRPGKGKVIVALSDGMGSGAEAARESNETVKLLEGMLVAGVDKETAVKLINSVLILKSYDENFATIDMLVLDLYTGYGEFIKTGSVGSYIKKGKKVVCLRSSSLPTGIVGVSEPAKSRMRFSKDDIIVIASDGVTEVIRDDSWIREVLKNIGEESAKEISDILLNKAMKLQNTHTDDMTVLAVKITEK